MYIGKRLKELRKERGLTLVELSEQSGVQVATLSRIENAKMTGTIESHMAVARALGVDLTQLYSEVTGEDEKIHVKSKSSAADLFIHSDKSSYEILVNKVMTKKMMPILLKIEAGGRTNKEEATIGSQRFIYVLEGKIEAQIAKDTYPLSKGNSLYFDASLEHRFVNVGKSLARVVSVLTPVML